MDLLHAGILAVVQGTTEFLPVSSSAHLLLVSRALGYGTHPVSVAILLHGATLIAVVLYFAKDLRNLAAGILFRGDRGARRQGLALLLGSIPIGAVGLLVYHGFEPFRAMPVIAVAFIVSGALLIAVDLAARRGLFRSVSSVPLWRKGIGIGMFQALALIPGVSRSGITITAGRLFGLSRREATRFSFLLSVPVLSGSLLALLAVAPDDTALFGAVSPAALVLGSCVAFCVALATMHLFLRLIERVGFLPFFAYQILVGIVLLAR